MRMHNDYAANCALGRSSMGRVGCGSWSRSYHVWVAFAMSRAKLGGPAFVGALCFTSCWRQLQDWMCRGMLLVKA